VPLRPDNPAWKKLYGALESLAAECGGEFAFVIDAGSRLWCIARTAADLWTVTRKDGTVVTSKDHRVITTPEGFRDTTTPEVQAADRFYQSEMVPRLMAMRRGSRVNVEKTEGADRYLAISFAGIYVLVVWFEEEFPPSAVRALIRRALPEIEALTLTLPPSGGPGFDVGAQKIRA
jgi:hypothetical protein